MTPPPFPSSSFIVTTTNDVAGHRIVGYLGIVRGLIVRTPNIGASILGGLKSLMGGNISQFANVCEKARQEAFDLMVQHARAAGADAVIAMRYDATEFAQGATEVLAYGTAVKLAPM
jgi:uncharacterized protein YbjQ (UPF0145 family)